MQTLNAPILRPLPFDLDLDLDRPARRSNATPYLGAGLGLLVFLFVGLLPSLLLGGSAGAQLALGVLGVQGSPSQAFNAFLILGVVAATTVGAAFFAVLGGAAASAIGELTGTRATRKVAP